MDTWTLLSLLKTTQAFFEKQAIPTPRLDAEILLGEVLGQGRVYLYTHADQPLTAEEVDAYRALVKRRAAGEPVAYLTGEKEFYSLPFKVGPGVLIPRPETEGLVDRALLRLRERLPKKTEGPAAPDIGGDVAGEVAQVAPQRGASDPEPRVVLDPVIYPDFDAPTGANAEEIDGDVAPTSADAAPSPAAPAAKETADPAGPPLLLLDLCTGSGCIPLTLLHTLPSLKAIGSDLSEDALAFARENRDGMDLKDRLGLVQGPDFEPVPKRFRGLFDLITANPPYLTQGEMAHLQKEVQVEPALALDGGEDGLDPYRRLIPEALPWLKPGGHLLMEIGNAQGPAVAALMRDAGFKDVQIHRDLARHPRVVEGRRPASQG